MSTLHHLGLNLTLPPITTVYLQAAALPLLVAAETSGSHLGHTVLKTICSAAFCAGPLLVEGEWSQYHKLVLSGLLFSFIGDYCLVPAHADYYREPATAVDGKPAVTHGDQKTRKVTGWFKGGVVAFAAAHVAYIAAFLTNNEGINWNTLITTFIGSMTLSTWAGAVYPAPTKTSKWTNLLNLNINGEMRPLVTFYSAIIGGMLSAAAATTPATYSNFPRQRLIGATMFVISDLFVARDAFGRFKEEKGGKKKHAWYKLATGWGLYFWGQMILAGTAFEWRG